MRTVILILIIITGLSASCSRVYDPHVNAAQKVLAVDGMVTDKTEAYHIILSYPVPFNSSEKGTPSIGANVYVTDDMGNSFKFNERDKGDYVSDSLQFTGQPGHIYRLHIVTEGGTEYESDPQRIFPKVDPDNVYAEYDNEVVLNSYSGLKVNTHGADILMDISNHSDTLPRFRITLNVVIQYYDQKWIMIDDFNKVGYLFVNYCWMTENINSDFNLTGGEYFLNSASVKKHQAGFLDDNPTVYAPYYVAKINMEDTTASAEVDASRFADVHHRILFLDLYTLNNETYLYYKSLNEQMLSEGKLFDPVSAQLIGNIKCITDPMKKSIGFFEASSVSYSEYVVDFRNLVNSQPVLIKTPYIMPPEPDGCRIDRPDGKHHDIPVFWIY